MKIIAFLIALIYAFLYLSAYDITIATDYWPPYADEKLPGKGFTSEIIKEAFAANGHNAIIIFDTWANCLEKGESGEYDAAYNGAQTRERIDVFGFSEPYTQEQVMLISKRGKNINYETLKDLENYTIGITEAYVYSKAFDEAGYLDKVIYPHDSHLMIALLEREVDLIAMDQFVAINLLKNDPTINAGMEDVVFITPPLVTASLHIFFSKAKPGFLQKLNDFNDGLSKIKENGTYEKILKRHGFDKF